MSRLYPKAGREEKTNNLPASAHFQAGKNVHSVRLSEGINAFNPAANERLESLARQLMARDADAVAAEQPALGAVAGLVCREATVMAYGDCFGLVGLLLLAMMLLVWPCRAAKGGALAAH
jgi:DHA2 family multidrug resistance protein